MIDPGAANRIRLADELAAQGYRVWKTVKNYVSTILAKLEVARRAEAAAYLAGHRTRREPGDAG
ncbi:MAG: hypothetical protein WD080_05240 [Egibacteraceae bacterium]